jgi:hypothetical protein
VSTVAVVGLGDRQESFRVELACQFALLDPLPPPG